MTKLTFPVFILKSLNIYVSIIKIAMKRKLDTGHYPSLCRVEEDNFFFLERWGRPTMSLIKEDIVHRKRAGLKVTACSLVPCVAQWWYAWGSIHTDYMILDTVYAICSWYWAGNLICASNEMCHSLEQRLGHDKGSTKCPIILSALGTEQHEFNHIVGMWPTHLKGFCLWVYPFSLSPTILCHALCVDFI